MQLIFMFFVVVVICSDNISVARIYEAFFFLSKLQSEKRLTAQWFVSVCLTVQEINHLLAAGCLKEINCMLICRYPACDINFVHHKRHIDLSES